MKSFRLNAFDQFLPFSGHVRPLAFLMAVIVYASFGFPTPDRFGMVEFAVGVLLIGSCGLSGAAQFFEPGRYTTGQIFVLWGLSVPFIVGIAMGQEPGLMMRDIIPFLFLTLPVFLAPVLQRFEIRRCALAAVMIVGVFFAVRVIWNPAFLGRSEKLDYLANMPTVLATAILCGGWAIDRVCQRFSVRAALEAFGLIALSLLCLGPLVETTQRASLGVYGFSLSFIWAYHFMVHPRRALVLLCPLVISFVLFLPEFMTFLAPFREKGIAVGDNMRWAELVAVWGAIDAHVFSALFGLGWGGGFESPAVAGLQVNFTHSLLSAFLLKTGVIGVLILMLYLGRIGVALFRCGWGQLTLVLAVSGPVLIDVFLYASYKSLDFGLVLVLAAAIGIDGDETRSEIA